MKTVTSGSCLPKTCRNGVTQQGDWPHPVLMVKHMLHEIKLGLYTPDQ